MDLSPFFTLEKSKEGFVNKWVCYKCIFIHKKVQLRISGATSFILNSVTVRQPHTVHQIEQCITILFTTTHTRLRVHSGMCALFPKMNRTAYCQRHRIMVN